MVIISLNSDNQLMLVMVKCYVVFEVRTDFLKDIKTSFGFKGLNYATDDSFNIQFIINLMLRNLSY
jgi:hypothetical protein